MLEILALCVVGAELILSNEGRKTKRYAKSASAGC